MKTNNYLSKPVFICGHRKAGTTLLINLFDGINDAIVYPDDSGFFYMYYPYYALGHFTNKEKIDRIVNRIANKNLGEIIERQDIDSSKKAMLYDRQKKFINSLLSYNKKIFSTKDMLEYFIETFRQAFQSKVKPKCWIEKTTSTEIYAIEIKNWFKNAKFIHLIRDPRDNLSSLLSGWEKRYNKFNPSVNYLIHSMIERGLLGFNMAITNRKIIGKSNYLVVKYEDLVSNPNETMKELAKFVGISFSDILVQPSTFSNNWVGNNFEGKVFKGVSAKNVGKWNTRISQENAMLMEYYFSDLMDYFGYKKSFNIKKCQQQAIEHYKWYNFSSEWSEI